LPLWLGGTLLVLAVVGYLVAEIVKDCVVVRAAEDNVFAAVHNVVADTVGHVDEIVST